jgi:AhpD family alkylhydroperoxidase
MILENKIKELIAIGASITANCQPCLQFHITKAIEFGANDSEIQDAIEVGKMVRKGASAKMDKFAESLNRPSVNAQNTVTEECGCS